MATGTRGVPRWLVGALAALAAVCLLTLASLPARSATAELSAPPQHAGEAAGSRIERGVLTPQLAEQRAHAVEGDHE